MECADMLWRLLVVALVLAALVAFIMLADSFTPGRIWGSNSARASLTHSVSIGDRQIGL
jgi:hypothetical protein